MTLRLTIVSPAKVPPGFDQAIVLGPGPITIGRAPDNDLVLADPARQLSKRHCMIAATGGGATLTDTSANGVFVNGSRDRVPRDQSVPIAPGDLLQIGEYEFRVEDAGADRQQPAEPIDHTQVSGFVPPMPDEENPPPDEDFDLGFALGDDDDLGVSGDNPFADAARLLRETSIGERSPVDPMADDHDFNPQGPRDTGESLLPHGPEGTLYAKASGGRVSLDPFGSTQSLPESWDEQPMPDNAPSVNEQFTPPVVTEPPLPASGGSGAAIPDDWDLEESARPETSLPPAEPPGAHSPFLDPLPAPPAAQAPVTPRPPQTPSPAPAAGGLGDAAALRAFLSGAGMGSMRLSETEAVELLGEAGRVFRALVAGLQEALATRAEIKQELDVSRTMIGATSNNPLKLDLSVDEGVVAMLRRPGAGFLSPEDAVNQGFRDVQAHQMATMAAMHLALRRLLEKFDPGVLARRLDESSLLSSIMPGARKSKYWEVYCDFYASIAGAAESEFHEFFTKEFSQAYEEQSKMLK